MNVNEREMHQALAIEILLKNKLEEFFQNDKNKVLIFHAFTLKSSMLNKQLQTIELLIPIIRESIATGQLKRALKYMTVLESLMNRIKSS